jgi:hypothetical protein
VYVVAEGDMLWALSRRFGVPIATIARDNGLEDPNRLTRSRLILPDTPATRALPAYTRYPAFEEPFVACPAVAGWDPARPEDDVEPDDAPGCVPACTERGDMRVCWEACADEPGIVVEVGGRRWASWSSSVHLEAPTLHVYDVDLDGDGAPEHVVAHLVAVSNGMSTRTWQLAVLPDSAEDPNDIQRFDVQELGHGTFIARDGGGCDLLLTEWRWLEDALLHPGLYLVGRRWRWADGALVAAGPLLARRYTSEFRDWDAPEDGPVAYFAAHTEVRGADSYPPPDAFPWVVTSLEPPEGTPQPTLRLGGRQPLTVAHTVWPGEGPTWERWGDAATGAVWPPGWVPVGVAGRRVGLRDRVVWLAPGAEPVLSPPGP